MSSANGQRRSRAQMRNLIRTLTATDYLRLLLIAHVYARLIDHDARDLLHEAILRGMDRRTCRKDVSVVGFLAGVMKSLASDHLRSAESRLNVTGLWSDPDTLEGRLTDHGEDAEAKVHRDIDRAHLSERLDQTFARDPALAGLADGIADGMSGRDLTARLGIDGRSLAALRRRLTRLAGTIGRELGKETS